MNSANLDQIGRGDKFVGDEVFLFFYSVPGNWAVDEDARARVKWEDSTSLVYEKRLD